MLPNSPQAALGDHAPTARALLIDVVRERHDLMAEAHAIAETANGRLFSTQWQDLRANMCRAFRERGYDTAMVRPGGYELPVVNGSIINVWRLPALASVDDFASSATRRASLTIPPPQPALLALDVEGGWKDAPELALEAVGRALSPTMPTVLCVVRSTPRQLQEISWLVAALDEGTGKIIQLGYETIWRPEDEVGVPPVALEPFDDGDPLGPKVEPRREEGTGSHA